METPKYDEYMFLRINGFWRHEVPAWAKDHLGQMNDGLVKHMVIEELASAISAQPISGSEGRNAEGIIFTPAELKALAGDPIVLRQLSIYHDVQQTMADSVGAECHGNELRCQELEAEAARIEAEF